MSHVCFDYTLSHLCHVAAREPAAELVGACVADSVEWTVAYSSNSTVLFNWLTSSCCCHLPSFFRVRFQHTGSWIDLSRAAGLNYSLTLASISEKFCWCHRCRQAIQLFFLTDWVHHVVAICQFSFICAFNTHVRGLMCQELQIIAHQLRSPKCCSCSQGPGVTFAGTATTALWISSMRILLTGWKILRLRPSVSPSCISPETFAACQVRPFILLFGEMANHLGWRGPKAHSPHDMFIHAGFGWDHFLSFPVHMEMGLHHTTLSTDARPVPSVCESVCV